MAADGAWPEGVGTRGIADLDVHACYGRMSQWRRPAIQFEDIIGIGEFGARRPHPAAAGRRSRQNGLAVTGSDAGCSWYCVHLVFCTSQGPTAWLTRPLPSGNGW